MKFLLPSFLATLMALATMVLAKDSISIEVEISSSNDTGIMVEIRNTGSTDLHLWIPNSVLDYRPIPKAIVNSSDTGNTLEFIGVIAHGSGKTDDWQSLTKNDVAYTVFELNELYNFTSQGNYKAQVKGVFQTQGHGMVEYSSNVLDIVVDGINTPISPGSKGRPGPGFEGKLSPDFEGKLHPGRKGKPVARTTILEDCTMEQTAKLQEAARECSRIAQAGGWIAVDEDQNARFADYFKSELYQVKEWVRDKLWAIANECMLQTTKSTISCRDRLNFCDFDTLAWTIPATGEMAICAEAWNRPVVTHDCHSSDLATTLLHEMSHINGVYGSGTFDFPEAERWPGCKDVSPMKATDSADGYAYFAQSAYLMCDIPY